MQQSYDPWKQIESSDGFDPSNEGFNNRYIHGNFLIDANLKFTEKWLRKRDHSNKGETL